jgi:long-chain acyl-CoA synthetase
LVVAGSGKAESNGCLAAADVDRKASMNLTELLDEAVSRWPQKPAFVEDATVVSYAALGQQVAAAAVQLAALPISAGSRVGLYHPNSLAYVVWTLALWRVNAVVVPIPTECTEEEITEIANAIQLQAVLSPKPREQSLPLGQGCFFARLDPPSPPDNHGLNLAFIRFTSGTTNARKGVALSHETVRDRVLSANKAFGIEPQDTVIWCLPMAHHFLITIILYLSVGATVVLARHVLAKPFLEAIDRWKGTVLYAAPFHFALLARGNSDAQISSVRLAVSTTCALPQETAAGFFERFGVPLSQGLGVIELGLVAFNNDDPRGRWNSVGKPAGDLRIRIVNPDNSGCGELAVSGPGFFDAYVAPWISRDEVLTGCRWVSLFALPQDRRHQSRRSEGVPRGN